MGLTREIEIQEKNDSLLACQRRDEGGLATAGRAMQQVATPVRDPAINVPLLRLGKLVVRGG